jgi:Transmembrane domain of unknown function (DUF3566)
VPFPGSPFASTSYSGASTPAAPAAPASPAPAAPPAAYTPPNYSRVGGPNGNSGANGAYSTGAAYGYGGLNGSGGPNGTGTQSPPPSNAGFVPTAAGVAAGVGGAAAGLAGSVSSAWRKRGAARSERQKSERRPTVRRSRSNKRQAMLTLSRVEPWSVMKFSFVASVVAFIILFVAVAVLYMVLSALGVFDSLQHQVSSITASESTAGTNISHWFSASLILGYTAMLGALNIVLITALSTIGSVIYNLIAKTVGGIEVTLRETE